MKIQIMALVGLFLSTTILNAVEPTHRDIRYESEFKRSLMDLWLPGTEQPSPVIVFFHGGGFKAGDKSRIPFKKELIGLVDQGVAFVSVGYPFLGDTGTTDTIGSNGYDRIFKHVEKAIEFLSQHADTYNLDPKRMAIAGASAGALISQHLTYRADMDVSVCIAIQQPIEVNRVIEVIDEGEPSIILFTRSGPDDFMHNPAYARAIDEHCRSVGVKSFLFGSRQSGLPQIPEGKTFVETAFTIVSEAWKHTNPR